MRFKQLLYPCALLLLLAAIGKYYYSSREEPFYNRLKKRKRLSYFVLTNVKIGPASFEGDLGFAGANSSSKKFVLSLGLASEKIVRVQIQDPHQPRFVVSDVIQENIENLDNTITVEEKDEVITINGRSLSVSVNCNPFEINVSKNRNVIVTINGNNFLTLEKNEPNVATAVDVFFPQARRAYGLPEHAERLSLKTTKSDPYRFFNVDRFAYPANYSSGSLYGTVPILYAHGGPYTAGILWLNASETFVDLDQRGDGLEAVFSSESGALELFALTGPTLEDCVKQNAQLTGVAPLPSLFSLGYHQSRYSYMSAEEVKEVSAQLDAANFPFDAIWLDIDYTDDKKYFTWHPVNYQDPDSLLNFFDKDQRKVVTIIDPHIKVDNNYFVYLQCEKGGFFIKSPNKTSFTAKCWPGLSSWIDFLNPEAREFYGELHEDFAKAGNLHVWNDMNEPALFGVKDNSMPKNVVHYGSWKHRDVHNLYGFYQTMATYEGLMKRTNVRPFILTRAHFAGSQRFAAVWTGDNVARWEHLRISVPMCLTLSLAGISFCGADIGGFVKHPSEDLLQRWYQLGTWLPFFRNHSNTNVPHREPYLYEVEVQSRIRASIHQRYRHLPYWYTIFWQHCNTGEPVIKPLVYQYPDDPTVWDTDNEFLVGADILVHPVTQELQNEAVIYLPGGDSQVWYHLEDLRPQKAGHVTLPVTLDSIPVFYRGGSIVPIKEDVAKSSGLMRNNAITLYIFADKNQNASGELYVDDAESFDYTRNIYSYVRFTLKNCTIRNQSIHNSCYGKEVMVAAIVLCGLELSVNKAQIRRGSQLPPSKLNVETCKNVVKITDVNVDVRSSFVVNLARE